LNDFSIVIGGGKDKKMKEKRNEIKDERKDFICYQVIIMLTQGLLLDTKSCAMRNVHWDTVSASFTDLGTSQYEVLLEVSSNKFLLNMVRDENGIQSFEIIAMKGFIEITTKIIDLMKRLIAHLWEMVD
jgi:hypothetical protein